MSKYVLFYEAADDVLEGAWPLRGSSSSLLNEIVRAWEVREWNEVLAE